MRSTSRSRVDWRSERSADRERREIRRGAGCSPRSTGSEPGRVDIEEGRARPRRHRRRDAVGGESIHDEFAFDIRLAGGAVTGEQENRGHATMLSRWRLLRLARWPPLVEDQRTGPGLPDCVHPRHRDGVAGGRRELIAALRSADDAIRLPPNSVMTAPLVSPTRSAGESKLTATTSAPAGMSA